MQVLTAVIQSVAKRYGVDQKTVAKWKGRETVADLPTGPKKPSRLRVRGTRTDGRSGAASDSTAAQHS